MTRWPRFAHGARLLAIVAAAHACAEPPQQTSSVAAEGECEARIVVTFKAPAEPSVVAALATATQVRLTVVNRLLPDLYVLDLGARGDESACGAALERLRADARVRSADLDTRRAPQTG